MFGGARSSSSCRKLGVLQFMDDAVSKAALALFPRPPLSSSPRPPPLYLTLPNFTLLSYFFLLLSPTRYTRTLRRPTSVIYFLYLLPLLYLHDRESIEREKERERRSISSLPPFRGIHFSFYKSYTWSHFDGRVDVTVWHPEVTSGVATLRNAYRDDVRFKDLGVSVLPTFEPRV